MRNKEYSTLHKEIDVVIFVFNVEFFVIDVANKEYNIDFFVCKIFFCVNDVVNQDTEAASVDRWIRCQLFPLPHKAVGVSEEENVVRLDVK